MRPTRTFRSFLLFVLTTTVLALCVITLSHVYGGVPLHLCIIAAVLQVVVAAIITREEWLARVPIPKDWVRVGKKLVTPMGVYCAGTHCHTPCTIEERIPVGKPKRIKTAVGVRKVNNYVLAYKCQECGRVDYIDEQRLNAVMFKEEDGPKSEKRRGHHSDFI